MESVKEYNRRYYQENKEKWSTYFYCDCGAKYCYNTRSRHIKSKKHLLFLQEKKIKELEKEISSLKKT